METALPRDKPSALGGGAPDSGSTKKLRDNVAYSQNYRDLKKNELEEKIGFYDFLNFIHPVFKDLPPASDFDQMDELLVGDRKEKNKISARNCRRRNKARLQELDRRIDLLVEKIEPNFNPPFQPTEF